MAVAGNKNAADIGRGPSNTTPAQKLYSGEAQIVRTPGNRNKKVYDIMPSGARKQTDKVSQAVGQAKNISGNVDYLLRLVSGKRLGLPGPIKRAAKRVGF